MRINIHGNSDNQIDVQNSTIEGVAHESGHAFRKVNGKDVEQMPLDMKNKSPEQVVNNLLENSVNYNKPMKLVRHI